MTLAAKALSLSFKYKKRHHSSSTNHILAYKQSISYRFLNKSHITIHNDRVIFVEIKKKAS